MRFQAAAALARLAARDGAVLVLTNVLYWPHAGS